jgi:phosphatidylglycerol---prolipoprotein diacylglyceryl transferase
MIPVLYRFVFETPLSQGLLYVLTLGLVLYVAWSGARGAEGAMDPKTGKVAEPTRDQMLQRAGIYGAIALVVAYVALPYVLPASAPFRGGKGEGLPIHTYGILLMTGFLSAVTLSSTLAKREWLDEGELKRNQLLDMSFWALAGGIVGSRVLFIIVNWKDYQRDLSQVFSLSGGLVFYGGLIGAASACYVWARMNQINFIRLSDVCLPCVSLGQCLGRLGCFSAGCCWGDAAKPGMAWAVHFPGSQLVKNILGQTGGTASLAYQSQAEDKRYVIEATGQVVHEMVPGAVRISEWVHQHGHTLGLHPTQLYESFGQLVLLIALVVMRRYRRFHGQIVGMWLMGYATLRTTVELFRGDLERGTLHGFLESFGFSALAAKVSTEAWYNISTSQFISLCMFTLGATILVRRGRAMMARNPPGLPAAA